MQNKAKLIAICGICGATATVCLLCCALPAVKWLALAFSAIASTAVAIPTMASGKTLYSLLTYLASSIIGVFVGLGNIVYVAPIVTVFMPMAIVKIFCESMRVTVRTERQTIDDPFGNGDDKQVTAMQLDAKPRVKPFVKWILYYLLLEVGTALSLLATYLFTPATFEFMIQNKLFYLVIVAIQLLPIPYDLLLRGCFVTTAKVLRRFVD